MGGGGVGEGELRDSREAEERDIADDGDDDGERQVGGVGQRVKPPVPHLQGFRHPPIAVCPVASTIPYNRKPGAQFMVSADNLNLDVLELIFAHLDQHDLSHLCLVCQTFLAAAAPILYRSIGYHFSQSSNPALRVSLVRATYILMP